MYLTLIYVLKVLRLAFDQCGVGLTRLSYRLVGKVEGNNDGICTAGLKILDYPNMSICLVMNKYVCTYVKCLYKKRSWLSKALLERQYVPRQRKCPEMCTKFDRHFRKSPPRSLFWTKWTHTKNPGSISLKSILTPSSHLPLRIPSGFFPYSFPSKTLCFFPSPMRATFPARLIALELIILIISDQDYKFRSSNVWNSFATILLLLQ
jgi:hypothetical protein